jgi:serine/threonine-protein kinase
VGGQPASTATEPPKRVDASSTARDLANPDRPPSERRSPLDDADAITSPEQFTARLARIVGRGGVLALAAGADLELPSIVLDGSGRVQIQAQPGSKRPRLRFRRSPAAQRSPGDWNALFHLRSGFLGLDGIDVIVTDGEAGRDDRLSVIGVMPGTELAITDCTLTLANSGPIAGLKQPSTALVVAEPLSAHPNGQAADGQAGNRARIQARDTFLRSGGEGIVVAAGRGIDLDLTNTLVTTEGSLVHALGSVRPGRSDSPAVKIRMDQVTARVKGGLVHLQSTPDEPELPFGTLVVENTILSQGNREDPLFRLDGQEQFDELGDKIRWDGRKVAYDRIKTYRRDEVARTGVSPRIYDRTDWTSAFLPRDESPILGNVKFAKEPDALQVAWKIARDDLSLAADSTISAVGPDLSRIPQAPPANDL